MRRADKPDRQRFDEVRIFTNPRYKESELSGDEWRISAVIQFYYKGKLLCERTWRNAETALQFGDWSFVELSEGGKYNYPKVDDLCDQEGCAELATVTYALKKRYHNDGTVYLPREPECRRFCDRHKERGDCGLDDAAVNYEIVQ